MGNAFIEIVFDSKEPSSQKVRLSTKSRAGLGGGGKGWLQLQLNTAASKIEAGKKKEKKKKCLGSTALWYAKF